MSQVAKTDNYIAKWDYFEFFEPNGIISWRKFLTKRVFAKLTVFQ